jgi:NarL family two-component system response regulator LiaR
MDTTHPPVRITVVNDYEVVVKGLVKMMEPFVDRVEMVEPAEDGLPAEPVDLVLYDTFSHHQDHGIEVESLRARCNARHLVIYTWNMQDALVDSSARSGASAHLDKRLTVTELVDALERINAGLSVAEPALDTDTDDGDWPGRQHGLTDRESEILALITQGLSNQEIADRAYLSINTVKSYIRSGYRKMGVASRSQAVLWGVEHGFRSNRSTLPV